MANSPDGPSMAPTPTSELKPEMSSGWPATQRSPSGEKTELGTA
jgi:hypothetical protein